MLKPGDVVEGKYRIVRELGHGGMGAVYEGENVRIHRKVAIKVLHANVAEKADVVQRFEREAQAAGRIGSEHIVEVLDLGTLASGERFMVMEYLDGESLGDRIKRKKQLTPNELAPLVVQLLEGLHAAHAAGIVHRDLKPDNVYVLHSRGGQRDFVKILDFGVSKFSALDSDMSMTRTGAVMGTPYYMSPEQARGAKIDARSDLYSVGVIMYQAVTGRVPFRAETFNELVFKIALENADPPEQVVPGLDPGFAQLIQRTMTREADKRVQSAKELQQALQQWMAGAPAAAFAPAVGAVPGMHPGMVQSHAHLQQSAAGAMGASGLNTSGLNASGLNALGASGLGASGAMGASSPGLGQSGGQSSPGLGASGAPLQLTGSQPGLAMTSGPPKKGNGAVVAVVLAVAVLAGAGLGAYLFFLNKKGGEGASAAAADTSKPAATAAETAAAGAATAAPVASAAPSSEPTAVASSEPSTAPSVEPSAAPTAGPQPLAVGPRTGPAPKPTAKASTSPVAAPTSAPPPKPTATGRTVPGEL
jgi:predicted Ser/Thr protein kinase